MPLIEVSVSYLLNDGNRTNVQGVLVWYVTEWHVWGLPERIADMVLYDICRPYSRRNDSIGDT